MDKRRESQGDLSYMCILDMFSHSHPIAIFGCSWSLQLWDACFLQESALKAPPASHWHTSHSFIFLTSRSPLVSHYKLRLPHFTIKTNTQKALWSHTFSALSAYSVNSDAKGDPELLVTSPELCLLPFSTSCTVLQTSFAGFPWSLHSYTSELTLQSLPSY